MVDQFYQNPKTKNDPPTTELQSITQEEFDEKLQIHHEWLKLDPDQKEEKIGKRLNLEKYDLTKLILENKDLTLVDFTGSSFRGVKMWATNFDGAFLLETDFRDANLWKASLKDAYLEKANFEQANLCSSNLHEADLNSANLKKADLKKSDLSKANFSYCNLEKADLSFTNIEGTDFKLSNLSQASFRGAWLRSESESQTEELPWRLTPANFENTNLTKADFTEFNFQNSNLSGADFRDATLHKANLIHTKTVGTSFGGANLTNAKLPEAFKDWFDGLKAVEDSSRITRTLFISFLAVIAFCFLTIAATTDFQLLSNSSSFPLPLFQVLVSTKSFYLVTPGIIILLFFYFQIYLYQHFKLIAKLPAVFPDGSSINEKMYPWILNSWTQCFFSILPKGFFPQLKKVVVICLCWISAPVALLVFLVRYLVVHDSWGTGFHYVLIVLITFLSLGFLVQIEEKVFKFQSSLREKLFHLLWAFLIICVSSVFYHLPKNVGNELELFWKTSLGSNPLINNLSKKIYRASFANKDVSFRAEMWDPQRPLAGVKGADLEGVRLEYAEGANTFLVKANLINGLLIDSNFENANFQAADLTGAIFRGANLKGANFKEADLYYVDFRGAKGIEVEQMRAGKNWDKAFYDTHLESQLMIQRYERMEFISTYSRDRWGHETKEMQDIKRRELWRFYGVEPIPSK